MGSTAKRTKTRRALVKAAKGRDRKRAERKYGTTLPNLPLNKPNANEQAQKNQSS